MDERDEEELRIRAAQLDQNDTGEEQLPTHVARPGAAKSKLSEREEKIWEMYVSLLGRDPQRNNLEGVQWAADAVDAFVKWVTQKRNEAAKDPNPK